MSRKLSPVEIFKRQVQSGIVYSKITKYLSYKEICLFQKVSAGLIFISF
jgi:hypothetical protein